MSTPRPALRRAVLALLLTTGLVLAVLSLRDQWAQVRAGAAALSVRYVAAAAVAGLLAQVLSLLSWRSVLAGLGSPVPARRAARIYFVGQLGKYVPGTVWPVLAQMELGAAYGLSRPVIGAASLLSLAVAVPVALSLGLLAVPALLAADASAYLLLFVVLPLTAAVLAPPVLNPLLERVLRLLRRPALPQRLTGRSLLRAAALLTAQHVLLGAHVWLLARDLGAHGATSLAVCLGGFCLASVAGLLAVPFPAGAGVREAVLTLTLTPVLAVPDAIVLALMSRALLTACDVLTAGLAAHRLPVPAGAGPRVRPDDGNGRGTT